MNSNKTLLIGEKGICRQIAYVFKINNYEISENIEDLSKYKNYQIIICNNQKISNKYKNVIRINELYKSLDRKFKRIYEKKYKIKFQWLRTKLYNIKRPAFRNIKIINIMPVELLKPSELLIKVIYSKPIHVKCSNLENTCNIDSNGDMWGCCPAWIKVPFGNIFEQNTCNIYDSEFARIIKLSSLNGSFCLCNLSECKYVSSKKNNKKHYKTLTYPEKLTISIDRSCNLKCTSCRNCYFCASKDEQVKISNITEQIIKTNWLDKSKIVLAGQGEVFFSKYYKKILQSEIMRDDITILTNGTLFTKKNWDMIKNKYKNISVLVSIDAATKETYKKLRSGNFDSLYENLKMLGQLRKQNKIKFFQFNFVIQKTNYKEMIDFVNMAKELNVDEIQFTKLNNWGTYSKKEYLENCLILKEKYLDYELYKILQNPIFKSEIIDMTSLKPYIDNSKKIYGDFRE